MDYLKRQYIVAAEAARNHIEYHKKLHEEICRVVLRWHDRREKAKMMGERMADEAPIFFG
jgi:hypothetical protein